MSLTDYEALTVALTRAEFAPRRQAECKRCIVCGRGLSHVGTSPDGEVAEWMCPHGHQHFVAINYNELAKQRGVA